MTSDFPSLFPWSKRIFESKPLPTTSCVSPYVLCPPKSLWLIWSASSYLCPPIQGKCYCKPQECKECDQNIPQQRIMHPWTGMCFLSLVRPGYNKNNLYSRAGALWQRSRCLASLEILVCPSHHRSRLPNLSSLHPEHQQQHLWPSTSHKKYNVHDHCLLPWVSDSCCLWKHSTSPCHGQSPRNCQKKELLGDCNNNMLQTENLKRNMP